MVNNLQSGYRSRHLRSCAPVLRESGCKKKKLKQLNKDRYYVDPFRDAREGLSNHCANIQVN